MSWYECMSGMTTTDVIDGYVRYDEKKGELRVEFKEPETGEVLERIKDVLSFMKIEPSVKNSLVVYNMILRNFKQ